MINDYTFTHWAFSWFFATNLFLAAVTLCALLYFFFRRPWLFMHPPLMLAAAMHVFFQIPLMIYSDYYRQFLLRPWDLVLIVHMPIGLSLLWALWLHSKPAPAAWQRMGLPAVAWQTDKPWTHPGFSYLVLLGAACIACVVYYLSEVPFSCTGLYTLFNYPSTTYAFREMSLKLLHSDLLRYGYSIYISSIVPLFIIIGVLLIIDYSRHRHYWYIAGIMALMFAVMVSGMFNGSLSSGVLAMLTCVIAIFWRLRLRIHIFKLAALIMLCFLPGLLIQFAMNFQNSGGAGLTPGIVQHLRYCVTTINIAPQYHDLAWVEGTIRMSAAEKKLLFSSAATVHTKDISTAQAKKNINFPRASGAAGDHTPATKRLLAKVATEAETTAVPASPVKPFSSLGDKLVTIIDGIYRRVMLGTFEVGSWYVDFAQRHEPVGISGIPRLAAWHGVDSISVPYLIGRVYAPQYYRNQVSSIIHADAGFVFCFYLFLGLAGIALSLAVMILIEAFYLLTYWLDAWLLPAFFSIITLACIHWTESDFGVVLLSHGLLSGVGILVVLNILGKKLKGELKIGPMGYLQMVVLALSLFAAGLLLMLPKEALNTTLVYQGF